MEPEQYGWKISAKAVFMGVAVPIVLSQTTALQDEQEAIRICMGIFHRQYPVATGIQFVSAEKVWVPDFREQRRTNQWEMRSRDGTRTNCNGEPWVSMPGRPAMKLRRIGSHGGWAYYIPAE